ncbi:hypothetical protein HBI56_018980 [Parastagonospora nodorum]|uniref:Uncharacterized protein n=1 Tax=Phaeosphaeria nodorum (strain SN15 / ATCC MYA-4574 / FGSC 10173) TaxID=321614 RepID=A0A7U2HYF9_PHANO|nr:hypothetical protein HBH56_081000 [Parastagonospora nodorum]QRC96555.1 hypothetical protein JI435_014620 [Parastagonospora nodorum SN15]KAH3929928.1 hypothetical protein HBH54_120830 [Parastagonospora nodorum]KAH3955794.1 hypothetical protein HBH53_003820 [Parastagonospora nodorum]KAH3976678.1 hypothetical protein HBH51_077760 [Parastagonospora nodorum]
MCKEPRNLRSRRDIYEVKAKVARMQFIQQYEPWLWGNAPVILHTNESTPWVRYAPDFCQPPIDVLEMYTINDVPDRPHGTP